MQREVPRTRARRDIDMRWIVGRQHSLRGVGPIDIDLVGSEVGKECESVVGRKVRRMRVRLFLTAMHAVADMLNERSGLSHGSVVVDWKGSDAATLVIGHDQHPPARIYVQVTRPAASRRDFVELPEACRRGIDCERYNGSASGAVEVVRLAHRIEVVPVGVECQKRRFAHLGRQSQRLRSAGGRVEAECVDSGARVFGVCADVHHDLGLRVGSFCGLRARTGAQRDE